MKFNYTSILFLTAISLLSYSCRNKKSGTVYPPLSSLAKQDSIKNDELHNPIQHKYLVLVQRAVIRPIYVETEKNSKAEHKGYMIHAKLQNRSKSTSYQDIKVEISYFSDKGVEVGKENIELKKTLQPNDTVSIDKKVLQFKNTAYKVRLLSTKGIQ